MKKVIILLSGIGLIGCATVSTLRPTDANLPGMQEKVPGLSLAEAQKGFKLYKFSCAGCHNLPKPGAYTITGWEKVLPEMLGRAKISSDMDARLIRNYLIAKSK